MKKTLLVSFALLLSVSSYAQNKSRASFGLSYNKIEIAYRYSFPENNIWVNPFVGVSYQDINANFDDLLVGLRVGLPFLKFQKSFLYGQINSGLYFPNNEHYKSTTPFVGIDFGYEYLLGKSKKHSVFANIGYVYGKSEYKQEYYDSYISVSSTDKFALTPIMFTLGYGFNF